MSAQLIITDIDLQRSSSGDGYDYMSLPNYQKGYIFTFISNIII
jgi:hypothetical protein